MRASGTGYAERETLLIGGPLGCVVKLERCVPCNQTVLLLDTRPRETLARVHKETWATVLVAGEFILGKKKKE